MLLSLFLSLFLTNAEARPHPHRSDVHQRVPRNHCCVIVLTRPKLPPRIGFYFVWNGYEWIELHKTREDIVYVPAYRDQYGYITPGYWQIL
jgi:hypothetical protein